MYCHIVQMLTDATETLRKDVKKIIPAREILDVPQNRPLHRTTLSFKEKRKSEFS